MNTVIIDTLNSVGLKLLALRMQGVRFGRIMSAQEVAAATNDSQTGNLVYSDNAWSLCGDVSASMFRALQAEQGATLRASVFGEEKQLYLVVTHQIMSMQHRFVLPLFEPLVQEFLAHAVRHPVWFSFGNDGGDFAMILRSLEHQRDFMPILALAPKWKPADKVEALANLLDATQQLSSQNLLPSCLHNYEVTEVSTTIIAPQTAGEVIGDFVEKMDELKCVH